MFLVRVSCGVDPVTLAPRRPSATVRGTRKDAERRLAELRLEHSGPGRATTAVTLAEVVFQFREVKNHARGTVGQYDRAWALVSDRLRQARAEDISVQDIDRLYAKLLRDGKGPDAVRTVHALLGAAFSQAVKWGQLRFNPVRYATPPPKPDRIIVLPSSEALQRLVELVESNLEMELWLRVLMVTGGRRGESLALRWSDVRADRQELRVGDSVGPDGRVGETKTRRERFVVVDEETIQLFEEWRGLQARRAVESGVELVADPWVFSPDPSGARPYRGDTMYRRFKKLAKKAGMPEAKPHTMRHLMVTSALDAGQSPEVVAKRAGHSRTSTTLDVYAHVQNGADRRAAAEIGALMPLPIRRSGGRGGAPAA